MTRRTFLGSFGAITSTVAWPLPAVANHQHFSTSAGSSTQPDAGCKPGFEIGFGTLTPDTTGGSWAVGQGLAIFPRPDTMAEKRLQELNGKAVSVVIRVER